ncbi:MAG: GTP-binding protein [archaeon]|nr:GTP-binding protein [archaeon]
MEYGLKYTPEEDKYLVKVVVIGDISVGKTNIIRRITGQEFANTLSTIGVEFAYLTIPNIDEENPNIKLCIQIWDTSGAERYRSITNNHIRNSDGAFLVYDICEEKSFEDIPYWLNCLRNSADEDMVIYLLGNKTDLIKDLGRGVPKRKALNYVKDQGLFGFAECSAKTNENIMDAFKNFYQAIYKNQKNKLKEKTARRHQATTLQLKRFEENKCCNL